MHHDYACVKHQTIIRAAKNPTYAQYTQSSHIYINIVPKCACVQTEARDSILCASQTRVFLKLCAGVLGVQFIYFYICVWLVWRETRAPSQSQGEHASARGMLNEIVMRMCIARIMYSSMFTYGISRVQRRISMRFDVYAQYYSI